MGDQSPSLPQQEQEEPSLCGPREEWALRWLLKKFQSDDILSDRFGISLSYCDIALIHPSPCLEPKAWLLLRTLVKRIPLTNTARLLNTFKFTTIVKDTLQWLQQKVDLERETLPPDNNDALAAAESSSATLEVSPIEAPQRSRKRKRDGAPILSSQPSSTASFNIKTLYNAICSTIKEVEALTRDTPDRTRGFAIEYIKATLRSSPEHAAAILGSFFAVTHATLQKFNDQSPELFDEYLKPVLAIWNLCSDAKGDPSGQLSSVCFRDD